MKFTVFWLVAFATVCRCSEGEEPSSTPVHTTATIDKNIYAYEYKTMTPAALREILHAAGVHLYIEGENPVFANQRLLAVHCKTGGEKTVALPRSYRKVVDVLSGTIVAEDSSSFVHRFRTPDTTLFELVE